MRAMNDVSFPPGLLLALQAISKPAITLPYCQNNDQNPAPIITLPRFRCTAIISNYAVLKLPGEKKQIKLSRRWILFAVEHCSKINIRYLLLLAAVLFGTACSPGTTINAYMLSDAPIYAVSRPVVQQYAVTQARLPVFNPAASLLQTMLPVHRSLLTTWYGELIVTALIGVALLIYLRYIYDRKKEKLAYNNRLLEMQAKALTNQMNPHFIYNSLSTVQHLIMIDEKQKAFDYISDFSLLMRQMLTNTRKSYISLDDEVDFLKRYLELEKIRFINAFQYEFFIDNELRSHSYCIPSMLIQPILENAIKHGFSPKKENNLLKISVSIQKDILECLVDDNGIGWRKKNSDFTSIKHESTALTILRERLNLIKSYNGNSGHLEIIDKFIQDNTQNGTIVKIFIPIINSL